MIQEWNQCTNYVVGSTVVYDGHTWLAKEQNAGKKPTENPQYWEDLGPVVPSGTVRHDDTTEKSGTSATEFFHLSQNEAAAAQNSRDPGAANPFVTESQVPEMALSMGAFELLDKPAGFGVIYGARYDEAARVLGIVGDGKVAWLNDAAGTWTVQEIAGAWRDILRHGANWVVVGIDVTAAGPVGALVMGNIPPGAYNAAATSGGRVVAVGDGNAAWSDNGVAGWQGVSTAKGYGDGIAYNEADGLFYAVGYSGCQTTQTGHVWTPDASMPSGTWRDIRRGNGCMIAASGRLAHKLDGEDWTPDETNIGGWDAIASGGGYNMAVTNGKCVTSRDRGFAYEAKEIPDYVYTTVTYGGGRFWVLGSAIVAARVTNVAEGLANAENPSASNPLVTKSYVDKAVADAIEAARVTWGGM